jgi:eukaryotic-like serine/threonine-protein kinase
LRRLIGSGGMAAVYAAENLEGLCAAVKLLHPEMAMRKEIRERFLREAAVMARIRHPGMVTIYEQGQSGDSTFLAMELLNGETFANRVRRSGRLDPNEVLVLLDRVLDVLIVAHAQGVVHRDLKPDNLFLTQEGSVKVLDFGLARLLDAGDQSLHTRTGAALGTLPYMAPEQALGRRGEVDARTDIFALGATAFRLLTGKRVHEAQSDAELLICMASEPAKALLSVAPDLSPDLGLVVDRALAFAKGSRYPNAGTMQSDVRALLAGQPPPHALESRDRDASATRPVRQSPAAPSSAPAAPESTRPLFAVASGDTNATRVDPANAAPTDLNPTIDPTVVDAEALPNPSAPTSRRVIAPTVPMPMSTRDVATVPDRHGASIPAAPMSDVVLVRKRQRVLIVGLLLFGLLGVAMAIGWYLFTRRGSTAQEHQIERIIDSGRSVRKLKP